jgi:hypothetical protein
LAQLRNPVIWSAMVLDKGTNSVSTSAISNREIPAGVWELLGFLALVQKLGESLYESRSGKGSSTPKSTEGK